MKNIFTILSVILFVIYLNVSCEKDDESSRLNAVFSYYADGFSVSFTNFSTNAKNYVWDFNDGSEESTLKNPVHVFKGKGNYVVTLTAMNDNQQDVFEDTVKIYGPSIKIDGDFTDWAYIDYSFINEDSLGGTLRAIKTFTYGNNINIYLEGTQDMNLEMMDMYINADNNPSTGFSSWEWPVSSGAEYLFEGSTADGYTYLHTSSDPTAWEWEQQNTFIEVCKFSPVKVVEDRHVIEFSIDKTKIGSPSGQITFAISEINPMSWATLGSMPANQQETSAFLTVKL